MVAMEALRIGLVEKFGWSEEGCLHSGETEEDDDGDFHAGVHVETPDHEAGEETKGPV